MSQTSQTILASLDAFQERGGKLSNNDIIQYHLLCAMPDCTSNIDSNFSGSDDVSFVWLSVGDRDECAYAVEHLVGYFDDEGRNYPDSTLDGTEPEDVAVGTRYRAVDCNTTPISPYVSDWHEAARVVINAVENAIEDSRNAVEIV